MSFCGQKTTRRNTAPTGKHQEISPSPRGVWTLITKPEVLANLWKLNIRLLAGFIRTTVQQLAGAKTGPRK